MININIEKFIKDRIWYGWYWTGTVFPYRADPYWCKLRTEHGRSIGIDVREFKAW